MKRAGLNARWLLAVFLFIASGIFLSSCDGSSSSRGASTTQQGFSVDQLVCASATFCSAEGTYGASTRDVLIETLNGGRTWVKASIPSDVVLGLSPISCGSATTCLVSGYTGTKSHHRSYIFYTSDAGRFWTNRASRTLSSEAIWTESCWSTTDCVVIHSDGTGDEMSSDSTSDGGQTWKAGGVFPYPLISELDCFDSHHCLAIGSSASAVNHFVRTQNGGRSWSSTGLVLGILAVQMYATAGGLECTSDSSCLISGGEVGPSLYRTVDDGTTVTGVSLPGVKSGLKDVYVSCPNSSVCYVVTSTGVLLKSTNSGASFRSVTLLSFSNSFINAISCPTTSTCVIGSGFSDSLKSIFRTDNGGSSWVKESAPR